MSFAYTPKYIKAWSEKVVEYLTGDSDSFKSCFDKFDEQMGILTQDNVWTGQAAKKNFENFCETHNAMVSFVNSFEIAFSQSMEDLAASVNDMETKNLGENVNISAVFGQLNRITVSELTVRNFNTEKVVYNYAEISGIHETLKSIKGELDNVKSSLDSKINELNNGEEIWDGNNADTSKTSLLNTLKSNYETIIAQLDICISNIGAAADNARVADGN